MTTGEKRTSPCAVFLPWAPSGVCGRGAQSGLSRPGGGSGRPREGRSGESTAAGRAWGHVDLTPAPAAQGPTQGPVRSATAQGEGWSGSEAPQDPHPGACYWSTQRVSEDRPFGPAGASSLLTPVRTAGPMAASPAAGVGCAHSPGTQTVLSALWAPSPHGPPDL